ncbi:SixA phosphatase family protein [Aquimarina aggregata]|uniref:SixA phosphatase family protein n=1 Tax=Aquimarina aggregata TaxID=1642818 RepID=UPI0024901A27|nr:phosphoglycerate mutase family protein [Aquimarina aggregata]
MKSITFLSVFFICIISFAQDQKTSTTYFLVRHAEKDLSDPKNRNPKLTEEGVLRAHNWAKILKDTKIDMVFSTDYFRTKETAKPIADSQNLEVKLYDPRNLYNEDFQQQTKGKTVVIVGHSNTTPTFANKIIGNDKYASIDEKIYGKLFIISIKDDKIADIVLNID